jgi:hypothetical protein
MPEALASHDPATVRSLDEALCRGRERALVLMDRDGSKSARDAKLAPLY